MDQVQRGTVEKSSTQPPSAWPFTRAAPAQEVSGVLISRGWASVAHFSLPIPHPSTSCAVPWPLHATPCPQPGFWTSIISSDGGSCDPKYRHLTQDSKQGWEQRARLELQSPQTVPRSGGKMVMGKRWQWGMCIRLSVPGLPYAPFPPALLGVLGDLLWELSRRAPCWGARGRARQPRGSCAAEMRPCGPGGRLASAVLSWCGKPEATMAPGARPNFLWGLRPSFCFARCSPRGLALLHPRISCKGAASFLG